MILGLTGPSSGSTLIIIKVLLPTDVQKELI
jgi:hypothetical protein